MDSSKSAFGSVQDGSGCGRGSPRNRVVSAISAKALANSLRASCRVSPEVMVPGKSKTSACTLIEELVPSFVGQHTESPRKFVEDSPTSLSLHHALPVRKARPKWIFQTRNSISCPENSLSLGFDCLY